MAKAQRKNLSFQAGEISPRFYGRSDTEIYSKGLATAENVFIDKRGGAFRRGGIEHRWQLDGNYGRVFTNQINVNRFDTFVLTDLRLDVFAPGAGFLGQDLLTNSNFFDQGDSWTVTKNPDSSIVGFSTGSCNLIPQTEITQYVKNPSFDSGGDQWVTRTTNQSTVQFINGQAILTPRQQGVPNTHYAGIYQAVGSLTSNDEHTLTVVVTADTLVNIKVGTGEDDGTYVDTNVGTGTHDITFTPPVGIVGVTINCYNPNTKADIDSVELVNNTPAFSAITQSATVNFPETDLHVAIVNQIDSKPLTIYIGTTAGDNDIAGFESSEEQIVVEFVPNIATYWVTVYSFGAVSDGSTLTYVGTAAESFVDESQTMNAPWTEEQLPFVHVVENPTGEVVYFLHPNVAPQKLTYSFAADTYGTLAPVAFTAPPATWTGENWPATGTYHQGRLWLGSTPNEPQTFWASVSGSPEDFTVTVDVDSSSLEFSIQEFGRIKWMLGTKTLLIGTENGEHIVDSEGPVITPTDFKIERQSSFGSNNMQALQVGEKVFYMTPDGRRLRAMAYEWQEDNWLSRDLSFASEHITATGVQQSGWLQNPDALYIMVLGNGTAVLLTYDRTADTVAWTTWAITGLTILDVAVGSIAGKSRTVMIGKRSPTEPTLTKLDIGLNRSTDQYLDQYSHVSSATPTNVITGLGHLEGQTVQILVDGAVDPPKVVINGQVTTERTGTDLYAGLQIKSKIVTLPPDVPNGQIRSWMKRWNKVWALVYESKSPIINGVRPPDRTPSTPMDTVEPDRTTQYKTVNLGWDSFGQITIEEDLPVAMNILAIYGEMGQESVG